MTFAQVRGQDAPVASLQRALRDGRVHHAYRFEGPSGVGKELVAFALAQALVCTGDPAALGCGACSGCRRAVTFSEESPCVPLHPDVVLVERGLYDGILKDDSGRKIEERKDISIHQIRKVVLEKAPFAPFEARARIFIFRAAEEMNPSAANALLKTLEEPRPGTHFVLLTSAPDRLLPTIRSRTLPVRFGPLASNVMRSLLEERGVAAERLDEAVELGAGSVEAALAHTNDTEAERRRAFVTGLLEAALTRSAGAAARFAESSDLDRLGARDELLAVAAHLARIARVAAVRDPAAANALAQGYEATVAAVRDFEQANAAPTLALGRLVLALGRTGAARAATRFAEA
ncbi:MAG: DNA polymerase III subunit [Polyangiaceae bacterium]